MLLPAGDNMAGGNGAQKRERARCAAIVRERRYEIERALITKATTSRDKLYIRRFIKILTEIEANIMGLELPAIPSEKVQYLGDFSAEEMERAQSIIEEQERNPFEGG